MDQTKTLIESWAEKYVAPELRAEARIRIRAAFLRERDQGIDIGQRFGNMQSDMLIRQRDHYQEVNDSLRAERNNIHDCYVRLRDDLDERDKQFQQCDLERQELWQRVYRTENGLHSDNYVRCEASDYHCYRVAPVDNWHGAVDVEDYCKSMINHAAPNVDSAMYNIDRSVQTQILLDNVQKTCAKRLQWEGDITQGPYVAGAPMGTYRLEPILMWKQSNNGSTFVCSPSPMDWLEDHP